MLLIIGLVALALVDESTGVAGSLWRTALCGIGFGLFQLPNNREMMGSLLPEAVPTFQGDEHHTHGGAVVWCRTGRSGAGTGLLIQVTLWLGAALPCWHCWRACRGYRSPSGRWMSGGHRLLESKGVQYSC